MERAAENEEKSFNHYFEVPDRVRTRMINKMSPDDRVRMTRCSKLCDKEAKASKNYVHQVRLSCLFNDYVQILIYHRKFDPRAENQGFMLAFSENSERRLLEYYSININADNNQVIWTTEVDNNSTNFIQFVMEEFRKRIKYYQGSLKKLRIHDRSPRQYMLTNVDFGIDSLEDLELLDVEGPVDIRPILSKTHKPLKKLYIKDWEPNPLFVNCEQIYQVKNALVWYNSYLDNQQFTKISAKKVYTWMGNLTERAVFYFIRSWQDGTIGREIECYEWALRRSNFDVALLLRLLRIKYVEEGKVEIKHYEEPGKNAVLHWNRFLLRFDANLGGP